MRTLFFSLSLASLILCGCFALQHGINPDGSTNQAAYVVRPGIASGLETTQAVAGAVPLQPWSSMVVAGCLALNSILSGLAAWKSHTSGSAANPPPAKGP